MKTPCANRTGGSRKLDPESDFGKAEGSSDSVRRREMDAQQENYTCERRASS